MAERTSFEERQAAKDEKADMAQYRREMSGRDDAASRAYRQGHSEAKGATLGKLREHAKGAGGNGPDEDADDPTVRLAYEEGLKHGAADNPKNPVKRAKAAGQKAKTRATRSAQRSGRRVVKAATSGPVDIGNALLTFIGVGRGLVFLYLLLTSAQATSGLLGFISKAVKWFVSPTAGIWHS